MKPGVFFVAKAQKHYSDANMDDDTAREFLAKGWLKPDMFMKLPAEPTPAPEPAPAQAEPKAEAAPTPKPAQRSAKPKKEKKEAIKKINSNENTERRRRPQVDNQNKQADKPVNIGHHAVWRKKRLPECY